MACDFEPAPARQPDVNKAMPPRGMYFGGTDSHQSDRTADLPWQDALASLGISMRGREHVFAGTTLVLPRDTALYLEGSSAEHWYELVSGAVRMVRQDVSGRRQIPEIRLAGQCFGLDDLGRTHLLGTEVASRNGAVVVRRSRALLNAWIATEPRMLRWLLDNARNSMDAAHQRLHKLGCMDSLERVADFLLEMEHRMACPACRAQRQGYTTAGRLQCRGCHQYTGEFVLPLMGNDISDYLGITSETVSRCFGLLRQRGLVSIRGNKSLRILDRPGIVALMVALSEGSARSTPPRNPSSARGQASRQRSKMIPLNPRPALAESLTVE